MSVARTRKSLISRKIFEVSIRSRKKFFTIMLLRMKHCFQMSVIKTLPGCITERVETGENPQIQLTRATNCSKNRQDVYQVEGKNFHNNASKNKALPLDVCYKDITDLNYRTGKNRGKPTDTTYASDELPKNTTN